MFFWVLRHDVSRLASPRASIFDSKRPETSGRRCTQKTPTRLEPRFERPKRHPKRPEPPWTTFSQLLLCRICTFIGIERPKRHTNSLATPPPCHLSPYPATCHPTLPPATPPCHLPPHPATCHHPTLPRACGPRVFFQFCIPNPHTTPNRSRWSSY